MAAVGHLLNSLASAFSKASRTIYTSSSRDQVAVQTLRTLCNMREFYARRTRSITVVQTTNERENHVRPAFLDAHETSLFLLKNRHLHQIFPKPNLRKIVLTNAIVDLKRKFQLNFQLLAER